MIEKGKSKRGGARPNAGRKRDPLKDLRTGALTAQRILRGLKDEEEIPKLYKDLNSAQKLATIFRLREQAYGKAPVAEQEKSQKQPIQVNVNIRRIGA